MESKAKTITLVPIVADVKCGECQQAASRAQENWAGTTHMHKSIPFFFSIADLSVAEKVFPEYQDLLKQAQILLHSLLS